MVNPSKQLLTPQNSALILIDHQPQMFFAVQSHDRSLILNNVVGLAKAARAFNVPTVLSTVGASAFAGPLVGELQSVFPDVAPIDRTTMNAWEDDAFYDAVKEKGRKKLVIAALWTEICLAFPALSAMEEGYEVHAVADASGGVSVEAHELAMQRMIQAGVKPVTWEVVVAEWQRDWARRETADDVRDIMVHHAGAFGMGVVYAKAMWGGVEGKRGAPEKVAAGRRPG